MKKFIILVMLISIVPLSAMDEQNEDTPCYLALPIEILDAIAQYLVFTDVESDEEFVERTKKIFKKPIPADYKTLFPIFFEKDSHSTLSAFSANGKYVALLNLLFGDNILPELLIINTEKKERVQQKTLAQFSYKYIAISNCGTLVGTIHQQKKLETSYDYLNDCVEKTIHTLTIQNLTNKETQENFLNDLFFGIIETNPDFSFDFNKEKNKIIIHANRYKCTDNKVTKKRNHIIIPITMNLPTTKPIKKTFDDFCKQKGICKQFALTYLHKPA